MTKAQTLYNLPRLNQEEQALYNDLRDNRLRKNLRPKQARIGFGWVESALATPSEAMRALSAADAAQYN